MIDSAAFPSATMPVERKEPELKLMTVVEHLGNDAFLDDDGARGCSSSRSTRSRARRTWRRPMRPSAARTSSS